MEWTEYLAGILAREIPPDYELEAMKAQAVLVRTQIYRSAAESGDSVLTEDYLSQSELQEQWNSDRFKENYEKYIGQWNRQTIRFSCIRIVMHGRRFTSQAAV